MDKLEFNSFSREIDGQEYCSVAETYASNIIEDKEEEASIIYPSKDKFVSFRSKDYRITTDSLYMLLPYPIYKIKSVKLNLRGSVVRVWNSLEQDFEFKNWEEFVNKDGQFFIPEIKDYIITDIEYNSLPIAASFQNIFDHPEIKYKQNTFYYKQKTNEIPILSTVYTDNTGLSLPVYKSFFRMFPRLAPADYVAQGEGQLLYLGLAESIEVNVLNVQFQIEYIPLQSETKLRAHKSDATTREYTQVVNQRAETIRSGAFGKYLHTTAEKTGTPKIKIARRYNRLADVPAIGSELTKDGENYKLVANSWQVTNPFTFTVVHTFSKAWSSKSKHVAVDQKYRNWDIPFDDYIWRTIHYEEFVELNGTASEGYDDSQFTNGICDEALKRSVTLGETNIALTHLWLSDVDSGRACVLPVSAYAVGNSIVFSASMKDNVSAGLQIDSDNSEYCRDVLYCNPDGTLDTVEIQLSTGIEDGTYNANALPYADLANWNVNTPNGYAVGDLTAVFFSQSFNIDKDPAEALKITIQVHFIPVEDWIVIGQAFAENFPLIVNKSRSFRLYGLKKKIREGVDVLDAETLVGKITPTFAALSYDWYGEYVAIINNIFKKQLIDNNCKAWAITDLENRLFVGSNDVTKTKIYFSWKNKRRSK